MSEKINLHEKEYAVPFTKECCNINLQLHWWISEKGTRLIASKFNLKQNQKERIHNREKI